MKLSIIHKTQYTYDVPASYALQQLRMRPQTNTCQTVHEWTLSLEGADRHTEFMDEFGNLVELVELHPDTQSIVVSVAGEIETHNSTGMSGQHLGLMPLWCYQRQTPLTKAGLQVCALVESVGPVGTDKVQALHDLSRKVLEVLPYEAGQTGVLTTAEDALANGRGVCQDHTHVFISVARELGFPARYISGYLMLDDQVDQEASHAWAEAHVDGVGWIGFDVSNGICPDERYVQMARGMDYRGAAPTSGIILGAERENLVVSIQVQQ